MKTRARALHPAILDLRSDLRSGRLSRREFLRFATLLGASVTSASALAACVPDLSTAEQTPSPPARTIQRGGMMQIGSRVPAGIDHPARLAWLEGANQLRQVAEYLTETGPDNLTRPWLLERWEADEEIRTWTLYLRRGIRFNNGDKLTADDVIFTFEQWLDPATRSSLRGLLSYLSPGGIERVDDYTIRLHLHTPHIGLPEHLFHYPAMILHRDFEGDFIKQPIGTGPFLLESYAPGERAVFRRRVDYWRDGEDGRPLPYLDQLVYLDLGPKDRVAAMQGGMIDTLIMPRPNDWKALQSAPGLTIKSVSTAQTLLLRMRTDRPPWDDARVRTALKLCQDREKILQVSFQDQGTLAQDAHVAPVHPSFCEQPIPAYDPEQARALLAEAGYPDGLSATLTTKNDQGEPEMAHALKERAAAGGFRLSLNIVEPASYWQQWTEVDLGITQWFHRPLATMALALGYTADADGEPGEWNETHWLDDEFRSLLRQAEQTMGIESRRDIMCQLQTIMQERGPVGISYWSYAWNIVRSEFHNTQAHPNGYDILHSVWKEKS